MLGCYRRGCCIESFWLQLKSFATELINLIETYFGKTRSYGLNNFYAPLKQWNVEKNQEKLCEETWRYLYADGTLVKSTAWREQRN